MKEVLEIIAKSLVDYPEQVDVKEINNEDQTVTLELRVAESDMGKVIGKQGRIAKAIRTVVNITIVPTLMQRYTTTTTAV